MICNSICALKNEGGAVNDTGMNTATLRGGKSLNDCGFEKGNF